MNFAFDDPEIFFGCGMDEEATIGADTVRVLISDSWEVAKGGSPINPTIGQHSKLLVRKSELETAPAISSTITIDSTVYTVKDVQDSGACWLLLASTGQRRGR
jgi:hypothetical protein